MAKNPFASILAGSRLSTEESTELAAQVAQLTRSGLSLESGLRAFGKELSAGRLAQALDHLAGQLEAGQPLDAALDAQKSVIPADLRALIVAGVRTGRLADVLDQYVDLKRGHQEIQRRLWVSMAYPICLLLILCLVFLLMKFAVVEPFSQMYKELDVTVPAMTEVMMAVYRYACWWFLPLILLLLLAVPTISGLAPRQRWASSLLLWIPIIGPLLRWSRLAQFAHMMELLVGNQVPLPESLRLTAGGLRDANLADACCRAATDVEAGRDACESMAARRAFPARLMPLLDWGQRTSSLTEAFRAAANMFDSLLRTRATVTQSILLPIVVLAILAFVGMSVLALFMPLLSLITDLSGGGRKGHRHGMPNANAAASAAATSYEVIGFTLAILIVLIVGWIAYMKWTRRDAWVSLLLDQLTMFLVVIGWVLIAMISFAVSIVLAGPIGPLFWIVGWGVVIELFRQRRIGRQYGLLWLITVSAERSIPLAPAIEAFAREYHGRWRRRVRSLAAQLTAGVPLPQALGNLPGLLPAETLPLVRVGCESGDLPGALRKSAASRLLFHPLWQSAMAKVFYLALVLLIGLGSITFFEMKIIPEFDKMLRELGTPMPQITYWVNIWAAQMFFRSPVGPLLLLFLIFTAFYAWLRGLGVIRWNVPGLGCFLRRLDRAVVLDALSIVVGQDQPLQQGVVSLMQSYPNRGIRRRLARAAEAMNRGQDWIGSLFAQGLLDRADSSVLRSAQRVGNLAWALEEMADSSRRRLAYRVQVLLQTAFPLMILLYGIITLLVAVGMFAPLPALILELV